MKSSSIHCAHGRMHAKGSLISAGMCLLSFASAAHCLPPKSTAGGGGSSDVWDAASLLEPAYAGVKVVPSSRLKAPTPNHGYLRFGEINALDASVARAEFSIVNSRSSRVVLRRVSADCGCTSATVVSKTGSPKPLGTAAAFAMPIEPQGQVVVAVTLSPADMAPGSFATSVYLYIEGSAAPAAVVELIGSVRPCVSFSPPYLDFGKLSYGDPRSMSFTAAVDVRLLRSGVSVDFASTLPGVTIRRVSSDSGSTSSTVPGRAPATVIRYLATIGRGVPLGQLRARIEFAGQEKYDDTLKRAMGQIALLIVASVKGSLAVLPQQVIMGVVKSERGALRTVALYGKSKESLSTVSLESDNEWLTCQPGGAGIHAVHEDANTDYAACEDLEIMIKPGVPIGSLTANLTIRTVSGEQVHIPVIAKVEP